jgi:hypothetical protein
VVLLVLLLLLLLVLLLLVLLLLRPQWSQRVTVRAPPPGRLLQQQAPRLGLRSHASGLLASSRRAAAAQRARSLDHTDAGSWGVC